MTDARTKATVANRQYRENHNGICEECGERQVTEVHHIKPVREYPELATDEDNLMAVCNQCHQKLDPHATALPAERGPVTDKNFSLDIDVAKELDSEENQSALVEELLRDHYGLEEDE